MVKQSLSLIGLSIRLAPFNSSTSFRRDGGDTQKLVLYLLAVLDERFIIFLIKVIKFDKKLVACF